MQTLDPYYYQIKTRWWVRATKEEIAEITQHPEELARWWPSVWRHARTLSGTGSGEGSQFEARVKGWLPYSIRFHGRIEEIRYAERLRISAHGDFEGTMDCTIREEPPYCDVCFDWRVRVEKPIVRRLSFCFKLLFWSNHIWVMRQGLRSIKAELATRRAYSYSSASINRPETADCAGPSAARNAAESMIGSSSSANPLG